MDRKKLLKTLASLIFAIFLVHFVASKFYLYYSVWYLDILMHFLGGFWIGLLYFYLFPPKENSAVSFLKVFLFVFGLGIGWEVFEMMVNDIIAQNPFDYLDTISDLFFDLFGGFCAILYIRYGQKKS